MCVFSPPPFFLAPCFEFWQAAALFDFSSTTLLDPSYVDARLNAAELRALAGDMRLSIADYTRAVRSEPGCVRAFINKGVLFWTLGSLGNSVFSFDRALRHAPHSALALFNRGAVYHTLGALQQAHADYTQCLSLAPEMTHALRNRGLVRCALGNYANAMDDFREALALDPATGGVGQADCVARRKNVRRTRVYFALPALRSVLPWASLLRVARCAPCYDAGRHCLLSTQAGPGRCRSHQLSVYPPAGPACCRGVRWDRKRFFLQGLVGRHPSTDGGRCGRDARCRPC